MSTIQSRPFGTCAAVASLLIAPSLAISFSSALAADSACSTYSSAQDEMMAGANLTTLAKLNVSSEKQYATFQAGKLIDGDPDPEQPVCYLWFAKKTGGSRSIVANKELSIGSDASKDHPQCIYDKSCRFVAFPLTDRGAESDSLKLSSMICENRKAALSLDDVRLAVGTQLELKLPCEKDRNSPDCQKLTATNDPLKGCRDTLFAAKSTTSSNRAPASVPSKQ